MALQGHIELISIERNAQTQSAPAHFKLTAQRLQFLDRKHPQIASVLRPSEKVVHEEANKVWISRRQLQHMPALLIRRTPRAAHKRPKHLLQPPKGDCVLVKGHLRLVMVSHHDHIGHVHIERSLHRRNARCTSYCPFRVMAACLMGPKPHPIAYCFHDIVLGSEVERYAKV